MKYILFLMTFLTMNVTMAQEQPHIYTPKQCEILALNALMVAKARDQEIPKETVKQLADEALSTAKKDPGAWATTDKNIVDFLGLIDAIYAQPSAKPGTIYDAVYSHCMTTFEKAKS